jgi:hypothetical protein
MACSFTEARSQRRGAAMSCRAQREGLSMATRGDLLTSVAVGGALSPAGATAQGTTNWPSSAEARHIAEAGYIFGLPR